MFRPLTLAALLVATITPAMAQNGETVLFPSRSTQLAIQTARPDFSDVTLGIIATTVVAAGSTGSRDVAFYTPPTLAAFSVTGAGDVRAVGGIVEDTPDYKYIDSTVTATGLGGGSFTVRESYGPNALPDDPPPLYRYADSSIFSDPSYFYLPPFTKAGLPVIELFLPFDGANLVDENGVFDVEVTIPGDYSTSNGYDSGAGQHYLAYINPAFKIMDDFVYDPRTNLTRFRATNTSYSYDAEDPTVHLDVFFFGSPAAVPEPATWATMIAGFGMIGSALRRRRAAFA